MLKSIYRYILENQQHIKDYVFIQLLAFFWICTFLNDGVLYFERFNILLTSRSSILVFWVLAMIVLVVYACWLHKNGIRIQNDSSDFICLGMVPLTLILVLFYCCQRNIITIVLSLCSTAYIILLGIANAKKMMTCGGKRSRFYRLLYVNKIIKVISCVGFLIIINLFVCETILPQKEAVTSVHKINQEKTVLNKAKLVRSFDEKNWGNLSKKKKLVLLQNLADYTTQKYLGCCNVTVRQAFTWDEDTWGRFENTMPEFVFISSNLLDKGASHDLASTVLHETYHHYQYVCCSIYTSNINNNEGSDLYYFRKLQSWIDNFEHYKNVDKFGVEAYKNQPIEKDANAFAERIIKELLNE
jgi:hypothetical protein